MLKTRAMQTLCLLGFLATQTIKTGPFATGGSIWKPLENDFEVISQSPATSLGSLSGTSLLLESDELDLFSLSNLSQEDLEVSSDFSVLPEKQTNYAWEVVWWAGFVVDKLNNMINKKTKQASFPKGIGNALTLLGKHTNSKKLVILGEQLKIEEHKNKEWSLTDLVKVCSRVNTGVTPRTPRSILPEKLGKVLAASTYAKHSLEQLVLWKNTETFVDEYNCFDQDSISRSYKERWINALMWIVLLDHLQHFFLWWGFEAGDIEAKLYAVEYAASALMVTLYNLQNGTFCYHSQEHWNYLDLFETSISYHILTPLNTMMSEGQFDTASPQQQQIMTWWYQNLGESCYYPLDWSKYCGWQQEILFFALAHHRAVRPLKEIFIDGVLRISQPSTKDCICPFCSTIYNSSNRP